MSGNSIQPEWATHLPLQQQSVLFLAARGPDGVRKHHPCKVIIRAYRACVLKAAAAGRMLEPGEGIYDSFIDPRLLAPGNGGAWVTAVKDYFAAVDELPHHYHLHLLHGAQILGVHHPDEHVRLLWWSFYLGGCEDMHMTAETPEEMGYRLNDFGGFPWLATLDAGADS